MLKHVYFAFCEDDFHCSSSLQFICIGLGFCIHSTVNEVLAKCALVIFKLLKVYCHCVTMHYFPLLATQIVTSSDFVHVLLPKMPHRSEYYSKKQKHEKYSKYSKTQMLLLNCSDN